MLTLSEFLAEMAKQRDSIEVIKHEISQHLSDKEILNPVYQDLVFRAKKSFEVDTEKGKNLLLDFMRSRQTDVGDLYYAYPWDSFASLGKFAKEVKKVEGLVRDFPTIKPSIESAKKIVSDWTPVADDLKKLKSLVVKTTTKRAEVKQAAAVSMEKKFRDSSSLIKLFESHLDEYKKEAAKRTREFIDQKLKTLANADWDLEKILPKDSMARKQMRSVYSAITEPKSNKSRSLSDPDIRKKSSEGIERYVSQNVRMAEDNYRAFMQKMIEKIGKPVVDAKMTGSIWTNALLHVTTEDGEKQTWNTKMIINFSKYQKMFNQFPSTRKK